MLYAAIAVYDSHELFAGIESYFPNEFCPAYTMTSKASLSLPVNKYPLVFSSLIVSLFLKKYSKTPLGCCQFKQAQVMIRQPSKQTLL